MSERTWCIRRQRLGLTLFAIMVMATAGAWASDLKRGELLFQTCAACHNVLGNGVGPDITGIYGEKAARRPGFNYSKPLRDSGLTWDEATLRAFITNPRALVPGTLMTFPGYSAPADVADVIAYLKMQGTP